MINLTPLFLAYYSFGPLRLDFLRPSGPLVFLYSISSPVRSHSQFVLGPQYQTYKQGRSRVKVYTRGHNHHPVHKPSTLS